ncbi:hypothetical protein [Prevotella sp. P6B4]|uniref:hypothetical protein n=1 Tax=Prevotella sp. P6B4 TaxID=1410614 RepID=UPI000490FCC1|nr:hypothetical protein [Prevotella sp. P6B4]
MTQEQKEKLRLHVLMHKPISTGDDVIRFLSNNDIISFTDCTNTSDNSEYIINNDSSRKIWYSQLAQFYMSEDMDLFVTCVQFKTGEEVEFIHIDSCDLYKKCRGRKFQVYIHPNSYTFNKKSKIWDEIGIYNYKEMYDYIVACIENNAIESIGDILKPANPYFLIEI